MREQRRTLRQPRLSLLSRDGLPKRWRLRIPVQLSRENVLLLVVAVATVWMSWALIQQVTLHQQMSQQAAELRQQNAALAAQNASSRADVQNVQSGAWNEQEARIAGYSRPGEQVLVVAAAPSPQAVPAPKRKQAHNPLERLWDWLTGSTPG